MQQKVAPEGSAKECLRDSYHRVETMAQVHSFLFRHGEFSQVQFRDYLIDLISKLGDAYDARGRGVTLEVSAEEALMSVDQAVTSALIVTELVTNAIKHAFPADRSGTVHISFEPKAETTEFRLAVRDNGVGMSEEASSSATLGMTVIQSLTSQLDGSLSIESNHGLSVTLEAPLRL
jgi:two-component sensor histidine kinase